MVTSLDPEPRADVLLIHPSIHPFFRGIQPALMCHPALLRPLNRASRSCTRRIRLLCLSFSFRFCCSGVSARLALLAFFTVSGPLNKTSFYFIHRTHTHSCTYVFVRTLTDIMHSLTPPTHTHTQ